MLARGGFGGQIATAFAARKLAADVELVSLFYVKARRHGQSLDQPLCGGKTTPCHLNVLEAGQLVLTLELDRNLILNPPRRRANESHLVAAVFFATLCNSVVSIAKEIQKR